MVKYIRNSKSKSIYNHENVFEICLEIFPCNPFLFFKTFCQHKQYPEVIPICRIADDSEPNDFKKNFYDWREKDTKHRQLTKLYSIGNIGTRCMLYELLERKYDFTTSYFQMGFVWLVWRKALKQKILNFDRCWIISVYLKYFLEPLKR